MAQTTLLHETAAGAAYDHDPDASFRPEGREDDRALARMLGAATLLGAAMTSGIAYGLWSLAAALLS